MLATQLEIQLIQAKADLAKANKLSEDRRTSGIHLVEQMDLKCAELTQERAKCAELEETIERYDSAYKSAIDANREFGPALERIALAVKSQGNAGKIAQEVEQQAAEIARLRTALADLVPAVARFLSGFSPSYSEDPEAFRKRCEGIDQMRAALPDAEKALAAGREGV